MGNNNQGKPGTPIRTASLRLRTAEKGLTEGLLAHAGPSSLECPEAWSIQLVMPAQPTRMNAATNTSKYDYGTGDESTVNPFKVGLKPCPVRLIRVADSGLPEGKG